MPQEKTQEKPTQEKETKIQFDNPMVQEFYDKLDTFEKDYWRDSEVGKFIYNREKYGSY